MRRTVLIICCFPRGIGHSLVEVCHPPGLSVFAAAATMSSLSLRDIRIFSLPVSNRSSQSLNPKPEEGIQSCFEQVTALPSGRALDFLVNNPRRSDVRHAKLEHELSSSSCIVQTSLLADRSPGEIYYEGSRLGVMPYFLRSLYNASRVPLHAYSNTPIAEAEPWGAKVILIETGQGMSRLLRVRPELPRASSCCDLL